MLNPVLRKEIKTSLRSSKAFLGVMFFVLSLTAWVGLVMILLFNSIEYSGFNPSNTLIIYKSLAAFQLGVVLLIVPAITGGAISSERERQTLDLLLVTKMSSFSIIFGKLASSLFMVLLITLASLPVYGIIMSYGGISFLDIFFTISFLLVTATSVGSLTIVFSSFIRKPVVSTILTYILIFLLCLPIIILYIASQYMYSLPSILNAPLLVALFIIVMLNPFTSYISLLDMQTGAFTIRSGLYNIIDRLPDYSNNPNKIIPDFINWQVWIGNLIVNAVFVLIMCLLASWLMKRARKPLKVKKAKKPKTVESIGTES